MKLVSFRSMDGADRAGIEMPDVVIDVERQGKLIGVSIPPDLLSILRMEERGMELLRTIEESAKSRTDRALASRCATERLAPISNPPSCRDGYAFRQHVATARRNRGVEMIPEFDEFPVFYFTNHRAIFGEGDIPVEHDHLDKLDFELEAAIVIGRLGKNIPVERADEHIAGYTIMNDFSARTLQMEEMKLSLGPAKGKDFATSIGPWLVTPDELRPFEINTPFGRKHRLTMRAWHNGKQVSEGSLADMNWTFAEIIARASYGVELFPGDVIGSGTVGTGCYLELNGTAALEAKARGAAFTPTWLRDRDEIRLEIDGLGSLRNRIVAASEKRTILTRKREPEAVAGSR